MGQSQSYPQHGSNMQRETYPEPCSQESCSQDSCPSPCLLSCPPPCPPPCPSPCPPPIPGPQGPQGPQGVRGVTGPQGIPGLQGPQGPQGIQGVAGLQGAAGARGLTGATGPQGARGETGADGPRGATGLQGPQGIAGPQGAQGPQGVSDTIRVRNTITGEPGTSAEVIDTTGGPNHVLDFVIPRGATGPAGSTGAAGLRGATGATGASGLRGATGATGAAGPQGIMGPTGPAVTANSMSALNDTGAAINVILAGTPVPLPNEQVLDSFTADTGNTTFTVPATGNYFISYNVKTTAALLLSTRILLNGAPLAGMTVAPAAALNNYSAMRIAPLTSGDTLQLQLYGLVGAAVLQGGNGASLTVIRLS